VEEMMIRQMVETCEFGMCDTPVDRFMTFCPGCGVTITEECPFCSQTIKRKKENVFSCPSCSKKIKYCSECGRLYPVGTRYCRNSYCPSVVNRKPMPQNLTFWQNQRGNSRYQGYCTYIGNGVTGLEETREVSSGISSGKNSSYPLVYGEQVVWIADRYVNIWNYGFSDDKVEKIPLFENPGDNYDKLMPVIVDGRFLLGEGNNITFVNIEKNESGKHDKGRLFEEDLPSPVYSSISFNEEEDRIAFLTQDGKFYFAEFTNGEARLRWSIEIEKNIIDENNPLLHPVFVDDDIALVKSDGTLCIINEQGSAVTRTLSVKGRMIRHMINAEEFIVMTVPEKNILLLYNTKTDELKEIKFESGKINHPPIYYKYRTSSRGFLVVTAGDSFEIVFLSYPEQPPGRLLKTGDNNEIFAAPILLAGQHYKEEILDVAWGERNADGEFSLCRFSLNSGEKQNIKYFREPLKPCIASYDNKLFAMVGNRLNIFTLSINE
jgi:hypothetical protein